MSESSQSSLSIFGRPLVAVGGKHAQPGSLVAGSIKCIIRHTHADDCDKE